MSYIIYDSAIGSRHPFDTATAAWNFVVNHPAGESKLSIQIGETRERITGADLRARAAEEEAARRNP